MYNNLWFNTCLLHLKNIPVSITCTSKGLFAALSKLKEFVQLVLKLYPSPLRLSSCQSGDFAVFGVRALKWLFGRSATPFCMSILCQILLQISIAWLSCSFFCNRAWYHPDVFFCSGVQLCCALRLGLCWFSFPSSRRALPRTTKLQTSCSRTIQQADHPEHMGWLVSDFISCHLVWKCVIDGKVWKDAVGLISWVPGAWS